MPLYQLYQFRHVDFVHVPAIYPQGVAPEAFALEAAFFIKRDRPRVMRHHRQLQAAEVLVLRPGFQCVHEPFGDSPAPIRSPYSDHEVQ